MTFELLNQVLTQYLGPDALVVLGGAAAGLGASATAVYYYLRGRGASGAPTGVESDESSAPDRPHLKLIKETSLPAVTPPEAPKTLHQALSGTRGNFFGRLERLFSTDKVQAADEVREGIEEVLYTSDLGPKTVEGLLGNLESHLSLSDLGQFSKVKAEIRQSLLGGLSRVENSGKSPFENLTAGQGLQVWMIVGVNGVGKTTTIGKLAFKAAQMKMKVMVAAGDTFRAAAANQLKVWTDRAAAGQGVEDGQVEIFSPPGVTDPAAVAFDAVTSAKAKGFDLLLIDTAGRLHTQTNLMEELKKVKRIIQKVMPEAPQESLIVLDANSGQNALIQAKQFNESVQLTGAIVTKMDGTAKGGVIVGLANELGLPARLVGVGEGVLDLRDFHQEEFVDAIFS